MPTFGQIAGPGVPEVDYEFATFRNRRVKKFNLKLKKVVRVNYFRVKYYQKDIAGLIQQPRRQKKLQLRLQQCKVKQVGFSRKKNLEIEMMQTPLDGKP